MAKGGGGEGFTAVLQRMLGDIAQAMALPDADLEFCQHLQQMLVARIRAQGQRQMGGAGGLPGAAAAPGGQAPLRPFPGQMTPGPTPPVGELQRLMGAQAGAA